MKKYGRMYPDADYGARFDAWIRSDNREPYNSFGNGSAMRVSPCAWVMDATTDEFPSDGKRLAQLSAEVTHNHPEGIKGAMATADAIYMCRYFFGDDGSDNPAEIKRRIKEHIEKDYGYDLSKTLDEIRPTYRFNETCQDTVPQAIVVFWRVQILKMRFEMRFLLVGTATLLLQSREVSPRRLMGFLSGSKTRPIAISMSL